MENVLILTQAPPPPLEKILVARLKVLRIFMKQVGQKDQVNKSMQI